MLRPRDRGNRAGTRRGARTARALAGVLATLAVGCTRESVRIALDAQRRADDVQQAVFERQHAALCVLLYRDLVRRLEADGPALTAAQRDAVGAAWNDRDLVEFWQVQHERARALRRAGVDAQVFGTQSVVDLLIKAAEARLDRARTGLAAYAGAALSGAGAPGTGHDDAGERVSAPVAAPPAEPSRVAPHEKGGGS